MAEFKFDKDDVDDQTIRIMHAMLPVLTDENPAHITATLTLMLASYLALLSSGAEASSREADDMVDKMAVKIKRVMHMQRAHYARFSNPGNA